MLTSTETGVGIDELLERIVTDLPPPEGGPQTPLKALLFDSWYDVNAASPASCASSTARCAAGLNPTYLVTTVQLRSDHPCVLRLAGHKSL